ncbi:MAG: hypothetical protein ACYDCS_14840 [Candidatus Dormibacteria bacterium]
MNTRTRFVVHATNCWPNKVISIDSSVTRSSISDAELLRSWNVSAVYASSKGDAPPPTVFSVR